MSDAEIVVLLVIFIVLAYMFASCREYAGVLDPVQQQILSEREVAPW